MVTARSLVQIAKSSKVVANDHGPMPVDKRGSIVSGILAILWWKGRADPHLTPIFMTATPVLPAAARAEQGLRSRRRTSLASRRCNVPRDALVFVKRTGRRCVVLRIGKFGEGMFFTDTSNLTRTLGRMLTGVARVFNTRQGLGAQSEEFVHSLQCIERRSRGESVRDRVHPGTFLTRNCFRPC
jgi:hypothetical protein